MILSALSLSFLLLTLSFGQDIFLYPPDDEDPQTLSYSIGDTLNATWENGEYDAELILWCTGPDGGQVRLSTTTGEGLEADDSYLIPLAYDPSDASDRCHLQLIPGGNSANFEIIPNREGSRATTWGLDQPTPRTSTMSSTTTRTTISTVTSTSTTSTSSTPAPSTTSSTTTVDAATVADQSSSSGLSTGAKIGIGVGVGIAAIICALAIAAFVIRKQKKKAGAEAQSMLSPGQGHYQGLFKQELPAWSNVTEYKPIRGSDSGYIAELPGSEGVVGSPKP